MQNYRLHYAPDNASLIIRLALDALQLDYDTALVDRSAQAQKSPEYLAINPAGLIPALETPEGNLFETAAILLWLNDKHGGLGPSPASPERAAFLKWLFFVSNTLHANLRLVFYADQYLDNLDAEIALRAGAREKLLSNFDLLEDLAATRPSWFGGETPAALDFYVAAALRWAKLYPNDGSNWFDLDRWPHLKSMAERLEQSPLGRAVADVEGLGDTLFSSPSYPNPPEGSAT